MLDIKFIRENPELIKEAARKKHMDFNVADLIIADKKRLDILREIEDARATHNEKSEVISKITDSTEKERALSDAKRLKEEIAGKEKELKKIEEEWQKLMYEAPNMPDLSVPEGGEKDAREERTWGAPTKFKFTPKNHIELMESLDLVDLERGAKISGFRGYFLKNEAVLLSQGLWLFVLRMMREKGYTPVLAPSFVKEENLYGTGHFPQSREDVYQAGDGLYLSATAEIPMTGFHSGEMLDEKELPKKFVAFSPCFRREAGSYGKDTRGIYRLHEFFKVEQMILSVANHENSVSLHEELTKNAEEVLQALKLPYRVITLAGGDIGRAHVKTYDIEVWTPSENRYRESHSSSYYHDFQARRFNIRYRDAEDKIRFCYTLNNTAIATPRILISILENYQKEDGTIAVPEALKPYVGQDVIS